MTIAQAPSKTCLKFCPAQLKTTTTSKPHTSEKEGDIARGIQSFDALLRRAITIAKVRLHVGLQV